MDTVYTALVFPLLLLIGQTLVALGQRKISQRMDEGQAKTDAKRETEAKWREDIERKMDEFEAKLAEMNDKANATLRGQLTQMRSDTVHKAHRYLDDLGCASTDEKQAFDAEYQEYAGLCDAYGIENEFVENLHKQVMALPGRDV